MNLYSYGYLIHSSDIMSKVVIWIAIILCAVAVYYGIKFMMNRKNIKYRNVFILFLTGIALFFCIQIDHISNVNSTKNQVGQTVQIMKNVSHSKHIKLSHIYSSSSGFSNGMMIKAGKKFYTVDANQDNSAYHLQKAYPANTNINYIHHHSALQWNLHLNLNNDKYLNIALKFIIGFVLFVAQINLVGKNNLAPTNAVDQIINYVLGGIVGGIIYNPAITVMQFIIIILIWSTIVFGYKVLVDNSSFFRDIVNGRPRVIINNGHIDVNTALKAGLSANDIVFKLKEAGVNDYRNTKRVTLEQNGRFSAMDYHDKDANYPVIIDGKPNSDMLKHMHKSVKWLKDILKLKHCKMNNVFLGMIIDGDLTLTLYPQTRNKLTKFEPANIINLYTLRSKTVSYYESKIKHTIQQHRLKYQEKQKKNK